MKAWHKGVGIAALALIGALIWLSCSGGGGDGTGQESPGAIAAPCQQLAELERFRYKVTYKIDSPKPEGPVDEAQLGEPPFAIQPAGETFSLTQEFTGSFIAPDRFSIAVFTPSQEGGQELLQIFIEDQVWVKTEGTDWLSAPFTNDFPPQKVCDEVLGKLDLAGLPSTPDNLNGLQAQHVEIEQAELEVAATLFGPGSDMARLATVYSVDAWVAEEGWPARFEAKSSGTYPSGRQMSVEVTLEITDVDAGDIEIEPPI